MLINKFRLERSILFGIYILIGMFFYLLSYYTPLMADDYSYAYIYNMDGADISSPITSVGDILVSQYNHYFVSNGRFPAQFMEQLFTGILGRDCFNFFNTIVFLLLLYWGSKLVDIKKKPTITICLLFMVLWFFLPVPGETLLWTSGSVCYLWTSTFFIAFLLLFFRLEDKLVPLFVYPILFIVGLLVGWTHEGLTVGVSGVLFFYYCFHFSKFRLSVIPLVLGFWIGTIIVFLSPGIWHRGISSLTDFSLVEFIASRIRVIMYTKAFPTLIVLILYLYIRRRIICKEFLANNTILCSIVLFELLFGFVIGLQSPRQIFFLEVLSVIVIVKILLSYYSELFFKYRKIWIPLGLVLFVIDYSFAFNACRENYSRYQKVFECYRRNEGGIIPSDFSRNPTWFATHNLDRFVHSYFFTHNPQYYLNSYLPYYIHKSPLIVLPSKMYDDLYCNDNFCTDENLVKILDDEYYTTSDIDFFVKKIPSDDQTNYEKMDVSFLFNKNPLNDLPLGLKLIRPLVKRLNPPASADYGSAITRLVTSHGNYLLIDKPYFMDMGVEIMDIKIMSDGLD